MAEAQERARKLSLNGTKYLLISFLAGLHVIVDDAEEDGETEVKISRLLRVLESSLAMAERNNGNTIFTPLADVVETITEGAK